MATGLLVFVLDTAYSVKHDCVSVPLNFLKVQVCFGNHFLILDFLYG